MKGLNVVLKKTKQTTLFYSNDENFEELVYGVFFVWSS